MFNKKLNNALAQQEAELMTLRQIQASLDAEMVTFSVDSN